MPVQINPTATSMAMKVWSAGWKTRSKLHWRSLWRKTDARRGPSGRRKQQQKGGDVDKRCLLEARPAGLQPIAVSHQAESIELAVDGALDKFKRALSSALGKQKKY